MLDRPRHQGKFGEDYVRVLASAAGLLVYQLDLDADGVDLGLRYPGPVGRAASPSIEIQVKTWSKPRGQSGELVYDGLNERQFNRIAGPGFVVPRYLFLLRTPADPSLFAEHHAEGVLLRHHCFYLSLEHEQTVDDPDSRRRRPVRVPEANLVTVESLLGLLDADLPGLVQAG